MDKNRLVGALRRAYRRFEQDEWVTGKLGKLNADSTYTFDVVGRPNFVHVVIRNSNGAQTVVAARNDAGVEHSARMSVKMKLEYGVYVIYGRDGRADLGDNPVTPPYGIRSHAPTHQDGGTDEIATLTPAAGAIPKADANSLLDDWVSSVAEQTVAAADKATPIDADSLPLVDSAAANALKELSWANLKATLKAYNDGLYVDLLTNQTIAGIKSFTDALTLDGSVDYTLDADASGVFNVQSQTAAAKSDIRIFTKDGDGTDNNTIEVWAKGTPTSIDNRERLIIGYDAASLLFNLNSEASGTGTVRPLVFRTGSNTYQVYLDTDGNVGIGLQNNPATALDVLVSVAASGGIIVKNEDGTTNGHTRVMVDVPAGAGDAFTLYTIGAAATEAWAIGIDNSDSDSFKISDGNNLGTNDRLKITSGGVVTVGNGVNPVAFYIDGAAGTVRDLAWFTAGSARWIFRVNSTAESGSDVGSDWSVMSRTDAGAIKEDVLFLKRSSGFMGIKTSSPVAALHVDANATAYDATTGLAIFQDNSDRQIAIGGLGLFRRDSDTDAGDLRINYIGYNGGTTRFRDLTIYDGKNNNILTVDGSAGAAYIGVASGGASKLGVEAGASNNDAAVGGVLYVNLTDASVTDGTAQDLRSYSLPADTLAIDGQWIWVEAWGITASGNTNAKVVELYFGATLISTDSVGGNTAAGVWRLRAKVYRTGAATQKFIGDSIYDNPGSADLSEIYQGTAAETLSGAVVVKMRADGGAASDLTIKGFVVSWGDYNT